jgi:hypothetical protein
MRRDVPTQIEGVQAIDADQQYVLDATLMMTDSVGAELSLGHNGVARSVTRGHSGDAERE